MAGIVAEADYYANAFASAKTTALALSSAIEAHESAAAERVMADADAARGRARRRAIEELHRQQPAPPQPYGPDLAELRLAGQTAYNSVLEPIREGARGRAEATRRLVFLRTIRPFLDLNAGDGPAAAAAEHIQRLLNATFVGGAALAELSVRPSSSRRSLRSSRNKPRMRVTRWPNDAIP